jgi:chemotaxis protein methyltransferase CheR
VRLAPDPTELLPVITAIAEHGGPDFRGYALTSLRRRMVRHLMLERLDSLEALRAQIEANSAARARLVAAITVHVTAMFRDPGFFRAFRAESDRLRTYPYLRFWVAGCSTGEEVYSLAILLEEEGLYQRSRIYATDLSPIALERARAGVYPLAAMQDYTRNYQRAAGTRAFAEYYTADNENVLFRPALRENVVFAGHNLAGDASFNEFHAIFCRNVMIYFNRELQSRVHRLLHDSLTTWGYLGLGRSETVRFSGFENDYEAVASKERLFRKIA